MAKKGVAAIFGPNSIQTSGKINLKCVTDICNKNKNIFIGVVASICYKLGLPHFVAHWEPPTENNQTNPSRNHTRNLFPDSNLFSQALADIVKNYEWNGFIVIYEDNYSLMRLYDILQIHKPADKAIFVYQLPTDSDYKPLLKLISKSGINRIVLDCSVEKTLEIIKQGMLVGMTKEYIVSVVSA